MRVLLASATALVAVCSAALAQTGSATVVGQTHYNMVDCNAVTTRKTMLKEYNDELAGRSGPHVIDVLEQKKLSATPSSIACYGAYSFSDGSSKRITYKEVINSLGQTVWTFVPDT